MKYFTTIYVIKSLLLLSLYIQNRACNDGCSNSKNTVSINIEQGTRAFLLFDLLEEQKLNNQIAPAKIFELKKNIKRLNTKETIKKKDLQYCLLIYKELYTRLRYETINVAFVATIFPPLLKEYNFSPHEDQRLHNLNLREQSLFYETCKENPYLISTLIYHYDFSFTGPYYTVGEVPFPFRVNTINIESIKSLRLTNDSSPYITYLKALVTPPASWMRQEKKAVHDTMFSLLLSLKRVKKNNPHSYTVPKPVMVQCILSYIIFNTIPQKCDTRYQQIINEVDEGYELMQQERTRIEKQYELMKQECTRIVKQYAAFLKDEFKPWAHSTISPKAILMNQFDLPQLKF